MTGLDAILAGQTGTEPAPAPAPEPRPERQEPEREPRPEREPGPEPTGEPHTRQHIAGDVREGPATEPEPPAPPAGEQEPQHVPYAALRDERKKRQELERRLQELERNAAPPPPPPEPEPPPDLFDDPEKRLQWMERQILQRADTRFLNMSEYQARQAHPDMDEAFAEYRQIAAAYPEVHQQVLASAHPWETMYQTVQQARRAARLQEIGDPDAWREQERARLRAELEAEQQAQQTQSRSQHLRSSLPQTLASSRDTSGRFTARAPAAGSLDDILAARR